MRDEQIVIDCIGGNCPVQAEGRIGGVPFYFRARGRRWSMSIGGDDVVGEPEWYYEEPYGDTEFAAGWMPQHEALAMMAKAFRLYSERNGTRTRT